MKRIKALFWQWWPWVSKKRHQALRRQYVAALLELGALQSVMAARYRKPT